LIDQLARSFDDEGSQPRRGLVRKLRSFLE
jgi:hypothetical protein